MNIYDFGYSLMDLQADDFYSALSHPMRLRALLLLKQEGELCVCELTYALALAQPVISRHLGQLKEAGLLLSRRQGLWVYYRVSDRLPEWVTQVIQTTISGVSTTSPYQDDRETLQTMLNRPNQACC
jgi:ArsR family transcriptional regulator